MKLRVRKLSNGKYCAEYQACFIFWFSCFEDYSWAGSSPSSYETEEEAEKALQKYCQTSSDTKLKKKDAQNYKPKIFTCTELRNLHE